jgi:hypothetical protein
MKLTGDSVDYRAGARPVAAGYRSQR